ncbi:transposase [Nocardia sp. NBC_01009]|uniref:transposase n=1 Tax=Nocardia sp. NBC_01009 TaxID=2975996 RepID=UPI00386F68B0
MLDKELRQLVVDLGSTLIDLYGIGPSSAARLLAGTGDIHRFVNRDRFASWNGTAPWTPPPETRNGIGSPAPGDAGSIGS